MKVALADLDRAVRPGSETVAETRNGFAYVDGGLTLRRPRRLSGLRIQSQPSAHPWAPQWPCTAANARVLG